MFADYNMLYFIACIMCFDKVIVSAIIFSCFTFFKRLHTLIWTNMPKKHFGIPKLDYLLIERYWIIMIKLLNNKLTIFSFVCSISSYYIIIARETRKNKINKSSIFIKSLTCRFMKHFNTAMYRSCYVCMFPKIC